MRVNTNHRNYPSSVATHKKRFSSADYKQVFPKKVESAKSTVTHAKTPAYSRPLVRASDSPIYFTGRTVHFARDAWNALRNPGDGSSLLITIPATMVMCTPLLLPVALVADVVNTAVFPAKVAARYLHA